MMLLIQRPPLAQLLAEEVRGDRKFLVALCLSAFAIAASSCSRFDLLADLFMIWMTY
jgi:hypothetical protein